MTTTAPAIVRRAKTDRIGTMLKQQQKVNPRIIKYGSEPALPSPEPSPLPGAGGPELPGVFPSSPDGQYTRFDPGFGPQPPSIAIDPSLPSEPSGFFRGTGTGSYPNDPSLGGGFRGGFTAGGLPSGSAAGPFPGGNMGGPQGSIYAYNPVTGNPIYNVTGSPRPGFFDSRLGKFVQGVGSTALNIFVPGLGFVSSKIFDAARRANDRRNTGTDLSANFRPEETGGAQGPQATNPADPASRFGNLNSPSGQNVYLDSSGKWRPVSGAPTDIRWNPLSGTGNALASAATRSYLLGGGEKGNPNSTRGFAPEGRFQFDAEGTPVMRGPMYGDRRNEFRGTQGGPTPYASNQEAVNNWLRSQPAYRQFMQGRGG